MIRVLGRSMQIAGLVLLPLAMLCELTDAAGPAFGTRGMLVMLVFGACLFWLGRVLEGGFKGNTNQH